MSTDTERLDALAGTLRRFGETTDDDAPRYLISTNRPLRLLVIDPATAGGRRASRAVGIVDAVEGRGIVDAGEPHDPLVDRLETAGIDIERRKADAREDS